MNEQTHDEFRELIPAYALGAADAEEAARVAAHLEECAACRGELAAYEGLTADLALATPEQAPPPALKGRLLRAVAAAPQLTVSRPSRWHMFWERLLTPAWGTAVLALLVLLLAGNLYFWSQARQAPPLPGYTTRILTGTEAAPQARGTLLISADNAQTGALLVEGLPQLGSEQQYQLWLIRDGERTSGGVFSVDAEGVSSLELRAPEPLDAYAAFGITVEPAGGSPGPTGERVLGYNL